MIVKLSAENCGNNYNSIKDSHITHESNKTDQIQKTERKKERNKESKKERKKITNKQINKETKKETNKQRNK